MNRCEQRAQFGVSVVATLTYASVGGLAGEARAVLRLTRRALRLLLRRAARVWGRVAGAGVHRNVEALLQRVQELQLELETLALALVLARLL